ncbi:YopX family protein [Bacillus cereus]|uniref:YopX family protein n=1 Tax=Bacillus cereus TaxID=1396 RepID=UPI0015CF6604|nr:YopX family protein [Bacillus cereus]
MNEIKFRAWDGDRMQNVLTLGLFEGFVSTNKLHSDIEDFKLMQYTGLKDKNGKEIYEGDIVSRHDGGIHFQEEALAEHVVKWGNFGWLPFEIGEGYQKCVYGEIYEFIVIGNIYENPELLGASK